MPYRLEKPQSEEKKEADKRKRKSDIKNFYEIIDPTGKKKKKKLSDFHLDHDTVCTITAKTGSGKTNLVANLVPYFGGFHEVFVFCGTPLHKEPIYQLMEQKLGEFFHYHELEAFEGKIKEIEEGKEYVDSKLLVIVDDFLCSNTPFMKLISRFATKSRKATNEGCCFIIISQSYFDIPKMLRDQIAYNFFMRGFDKKEIRAVCSRFSSADLDIDDIYRLYQDATGGEDGGIEDFFMIDRRTPYDNLKFRNQILKPYIINERAKKDFVRWKSYD